MRRYYILSLKYSSPRLGLMFFRPDDRGYTFNVDDAAIHTEKEIADRPDYYDNGEDTRAIPVDALDGLIRRVVAFDSLSVVENKAATSAKMLPIGKGLVRPGAVA